MNQLVPAATGFHLTQDPISESESTPAMSRGNLEGCATIGVVTAFAWQQGDDSQHTGTGRGRSWVARAGDYTGALSSTRHDAVAGQAVGVRRLTPRECERLQGFPDDWTRIRWNGKPAPDSLRYAAIGDAVTVPVAYWIGRRLDGG